MANICAADGCCHLFVVQLVVGFGLWCSLELASFSGTARYFHLFVVQLDV